MRKFLLILSTLFSLQALISTPALAAPPAGDPTPAPRVTLGAQKRALGPLTSLRHGDSYRTSGKALGAELTIEKYRFDVDGIPVRGAGYRVRRYADGSTQVVDPLFLSEAAAAAIGDPRIGADEARRIAIRQWHARSGTASPVQALEPTLIYEAVVRPDVPTGERRIESLRLVWQIGLARIYNASVAPAPEFAASPRPTAIALVDARDGTSIRFVDPHRRAVAQGRGEHYPEPRPLQVEPYPELSVNWDGSMCLADITRGTFPAVDEPCGTWPQPGIHTYIEQDASFTHLARTIRVVDLDGVFGNHLPAYTREQAEGEEGRTMAADAHFAVGRAYDFFKAAFKRKKLGLNDRIRVVVNSREDTSWISSDNTIYIQRSPGPEQRVKSSLMVVGHEYTHSLIDEEIGGDYGDYLDGLGTEFGAIHEGVADIFGTSIYYFGDDPANTEVVEPTAWLFGWDVLDQPREFDQPSLSGDWDEYQPNTNIQNHEASGVMRRAFYFMAYGIAPIGRGDRNSGARNTSSYVPNGAPGMGFVPAMQLLYRTITDGYSYGETPTFQDFRERMVAFASTNGACTDEAKSAMDAWAGVNVGPRADRTAPRIELSASPTAGGANVVVRAFVQPGDTAGAAVIDVDGVTTTKVPLRYETSLLVCGISTGFGTGPIHQSCWFGEANVPMSATWPHTLRASVEDGCRNVGHSSKTIDFGAPTALALRDLETWRSTRRRFEISAQDGSSLSAFRLEVGSVTTTGTFPEGAMRTETVLDLAPLLDGPVLAKLTVTDAYWNSATTSILYAIDRRPPDTCYFDLHGIDTFGTFPRRITLGILARPGTGSPIVKIDVGQNGSSLWWVDRNYSTGSRQMLPVSSGPGGGMLRYELNDVPYGTHNFVGKCIDGWGNERQATHTVYMSPPPTLDVSASTTPTSYSLTATARSEYSKIYEISLHENGTQLDRQLCGGINATCQVVFSGSGTAGQTRTFEVRSEDVDHRRAAATRSVTLPNAPPQPINSPLAFTLDEPTSADFDMVITDPTGLTFTYNTTSHYVQDTIGGVGPDIAYWQNPPHGTYRVIVKIFNGNGLPTRFSLKALRNGSQVAAPNFPSSQEVFAAYNLSNNWWPASGAYTYTY